MTYAEKLAFIEKHKREDFTFDKVTAVVSVAAQAIKTGVAQTGATLAG